MKKVFFLILFLVPSVLISFAQLNSQAPELPAVKWVDWNKGIQQAQECNKIILIDLYTEWCGWCKKMDKETFTDAEIVEIIDQHFIPIKLNPENKNAVYIYKGKQVNAQQLLQLLAKEDQLKYPAILIYYPDQNEIFREEGFQKAKSFKHLLRIYISYQDKLSSKAVK